jgi:uncharacterized protein YndB with AHSA1/START domain
MEKNNEMKIPDEFAGKELVITRLFDTTKEDVFRAWTEPEKISRWWGPQGFTAPIIKINLRPGGKYLYSMKDASGKMYWSAGEFIEVDVPSRLIVRDYLSDERGRKIPAAKYGLPENFPEEIIITIDFVEEGGKTRVNLIYPLPESAEAREGMKDSGMVEGWNSSLDKLELLFKLT